MKRLIVVIGTLMGSITQAACPDITGNWAISYDESYAGYQYAGIGLAEISADKVKLRIREGYQGLHLITTLTGKWSSQANCMITWNYHEVGNGPLTGTVHGIPVSADEIFFMFSNPSSGSTGQVIAKRVQY